MLTVPTTSDIQHQQAITESYQIMASSSGFTPQAPPTDFDRLKLLIQTPASAFTNNPLDLPLHKQIWSADLTSTELRSLAKLANDRLQDALAAQIKAMNKEIAKLKARADECGRVARHDDEDDLRGDVCARVLERWGHEEMVEGMTGRALRFRDARASGS